MRAPYRKSWSRVSGRVMASTSWSGGRCAVKSPSSLKTVQEAVYFRRQRFFYQDCMSSTTTTDGRLWRLKSISGFGTDAVAGSHGRNAEEFIYRMKDGGQPAMDAIVSGTSLAPESLGLHNKIGT